MTTISKCICGCYFRHNVITLCGKVPNFGYCDEKCPKLSSTQSLDIQCVNFQTLKDVIICNHTPKSQFCSLCTTQSYDQEISYALSDGLLHVGHPKLPFQTHFESGCPRDKNIVKCEPRSYKSPKCRKNVASASKPIFKCCEECRELQNVERVDDNLCYYCEDNHVSLDVTFEGSGLCSNCAIVRPCMCCHQNYVDLIDSVDNFRCLTCHNANPNSLLCIGCEKTFTFGSFHTPTRVIIVDNMCLSCSPSGEYDDVLISQEMSKFVELVMYVRSNYRRVIQDVHILIEIMCTGVNFYGLNLKKLWKLITNQGRYGQMITQWNQHKEAASALLFTSWCNKDIRLKILSYVRMT